LFPDGEKGKRLLFTLVCGLIRFGLGKPFFEFRRLIAPTQVHDTHLMLGTELADHFEICRHPLGPFRAWREVQFLAQIVIEPEHHQASGWVAP
jgi:hypothetical protein